MSDGFLRAKVANVTLNLPVHRNPQATLALAEEVGALVASMEADADRIDSQAFALLAAYEYARRLKVLEEENEDEQRMLVKALDGVATALQRLAEEYAEDE